MSKSQKFGFERKTPTFLAEGVAGNARSGSHHNTEL